MTESEAGWEDVTKAARKREILHNAVYCVIECLTIFLSSKTYCTGHSSDGSNTRVLTFIYIKIKTCVFMFIRSLVFK